MVKHASKEACTHHAVIAIEVRKVERVELGQLNSVHSLDKSSRNVVEGRFRNFEVCAR